MSKRDDNVLIFNDTMDRCENDSRLKSTIVKSNKEQYIILESDNVEVSGESVYDKGAKIVVSKRRSLEAAKQYSDKKVCVHNFASFTNAGGGVVHGSSAQEEAVCRCSTLYANISQESIVNDFHRKHRGLLKQSKLDARYNDDCIFTPNVVVFKTDTDRPEIMEEKDWYNVDIITCAAPNLREKPSNAMNPNSGKDKLIISDVDLLSLHIKRLSRILDIAKKEKAEVVILGAFGCGAFSNPPNIVAEAMFNVLTRYRNDFEVIELAVFCTPKDTRNYDVFNRRLGKM